MGSTAAACMFAVPFLLTFVQEKRMAREMEANRKEAILLALHARIENWADDES